MTGDERWDKGLKREEGFEIGRRLAAAGLVDFINVVRGHIDSDNALLDVIPIMGMPSAPHLDFAGEMRAATGLPVFHAARITDVATARHAIAAGKLDMIAMTRRTSPTRTSSKRSGPARSTRSGRVWAPPTAWTASTRATRPCASTTPPPAARARCLTLSAGAERRRKVVVVGAGPAGLEAARVSAERGHDVVLFEATEQAGGQIRLASRSPRRRELIGIVDWRVERLAEAGVELRFSTWAEADDVLGQEPDVVFVATGGIPNTDVLESGEDLVVSSWDVLSGQVKPAERVLVFDDNAAHPALQAAELLAESGASVELVTPERFFAVEIGGLNHAAYARVFQRYDVRITINTRLKAVRRQGNELVATLGSDYGEVRHERRVDQVVVEHGTLPMTDLYEELKAHSINLGGIDHRAMLAGRPQEVVRNADGRFRLFRVGDAVASRNIHAAIFDSLRLAKDI